MLRSRQAVCMNKPNQEENKTLLAAHALKATRGRLAVLAVLRRAKAPLGAGEIAKAIPQAVADKATVYRVIESFVSKGILRIVNLRHHHKDYELADLQDHHHLVCLRCGCTEDFTGCGADGLIKMALKQSHSFETVSEHTLELFGICKACTKVADKPHLPDHSR